MDSPQHLSPMIWGLGLALLFWGISILLVKE